MSRIQGMTDERSRLLQRLPELLENARDGLDVEGGWFVDLYDLYAETAGLLEKALRKQADRG